MKIPFILLLSLSVACGESPDLVTPLGVPLWGQYGVSKEDLESVQGQVDIMAIAAARVYSEIVGVSAETGLRWLQRTEVHFTGRDIDNGRFLGYYQIGLAVTIRWPGNGCIPQSALAHEWAHVFQYFARLPQNHESPLFYDPVYEVNASFMCQ